MQIKGKRDIMRILFIAMSESIHVARWISQFSDQGWELYIFSSTNNLRIHPDFKNITIYKTFFPYQRNIDKSVKIKGIPVIFNLFVKMGNKFLNVFFPDFHKKQLSRIILQLKPDIIHSMEFQAGGYLALEAKKQLPHDFPPWIATNWGSDIYHFIKDPLHAKKIKDILNNCDYYSCECNRDVNLAIKYGLKGKVLPVLPNAGGFDLAFADRHRQLGPSSARRLILLKGYHGWAGRGMTGINALSLCTREIKDYTIAIFSASPEVEKAALEFSRDTQIPVYIIPPCPYHEMLEFFGKSRIYIGLSLSDAISTSLLEAMVMGAFPIQSNTSCADEWIVNGTSGFIVPPEDPLVIADAIKKAIKNDDLIDNAVEINYNTARNRLESNKIKASVIKIYKDIFTGP